MQPDTSTKNRMYLAVMLLTSAFASNHALADDGVWYLRAHSGLSQLSDTRGQTQSIGSIDGKANIELNSGFIAGMALGYRYGPNWAAELSWEYRTNDSQVTLADGTKFSEGNYASNIFFINGLYHFTTNTSWEPYAGAGLGWIQEIDVDLEDSNTELSYSGDGNIKAQLFAGVNYLFNDDWSINSEIRYGDFGNNDLKGEGIVGNINSVEYKPLTLQLGMSYRF